MKEEEVLTDYYRLIGEEREGGLLRPVGMD